MKMLMLGLSIMILSAPTFAKCVFTIEGLRAQELYQKLSIEEKIAGNVSTKQSEGIFSCIKSITLGLPSYYQCLFKGTLLDLGQSVTKDIYDRNTLSAESDMVRRSLKKAYGALHCTRTTLEPEATAYRCTFTM